MRHINPPRRRKLSPFLVLVMLLYGKHASVVWHAPDGRSCTITTNLFAKTLGTQGYHLRQHCEWLQRYGYVSDVKISHGFIKLTVTPPVRRSIEPLDELGAA